MYICIDIGKKDYKQWHKSGIGHQSQPTNLLLEDMTNQAGTPNILQLWSWCWASVNNLV